MLSVLKNLGFVKNGQKRQKTHFYQVIHFVKPLQNAYTLQFFTKNQNRKKSKNEKIQNEKIQNEKIQNEKIQHEKIQNEKIQNKIMNIFIRR